MKQVDRLFSCLRSWSVGLLPALALVVLLGAVAPVPAHAQLQGLNTTTGTLEAKAAPDDCWFGLGGATQLFTVPPCASNALQTKVNSGYVWAMAEAGDNVFFGTLANGQCVTEGGLTTAPAPPYAVNAWACEFADSIYARDGLLTGNLGDFRPPQIFVYSKTSQTTTDVTPKGTVSLTNPLGLDTTIESTLGIRAAVNTGSLVLMVGQSLTGSINLFAYDPNSLTYLGKATLPCQNQLNVPQAGQLTSTCYGQIRQFVNYNGNIYTSVAVTKTVITIATKQLVSFVNIGGAVLKYTGTAPASPTANSCTPVPPATTSPCFSFQQVGTLPDGQGAYIAAHNGRLYTDTWPTGGANSIAGLYMSPVVPTSGGLPASLANWTKVWSASNYDPDPVDQAAYNGGALADFDGYLYWGTMHPPLLASGIFAGVYQKTYGVPVPKSLLPAALQNTFQTGAVFRGTNFDTTPQIDLLYGSPYLPKFDFATQAWNIVPNNMPAGHKNPLYGEPGFGAPYNNYIWSMAVWNNQLWVGTMDWSYMALNGYAALTGAPAPSEGIPYAPTNLYSIINFIPGADLMFFQDSNTPAIPESISGVGNPTNYGVRNILPSTTSDDSLFLGMANPMNLLTSSALAYKGGWELIKLNANPGNTPVNTLNGFSCVPNNMVPPGTAQCTVSLVSAPANDALVAIVPFLVKIPGAPQLTLPLTVKVPAGQTTGTFSVNIPQVSTATESAIEAAYNGGTMVTTIQLNSTALGGMIAGKTGPANARVWTYQIGNSGPASALGAELTSLTLTQTRGAACTPVIATQFPVQVGDIAPASTATASVTIDFSSCATTAVFTAVANESANNGTVTGSITRLNQFR